MSSPAKIFIAHEYDNLEEACARAHAGETIVCLDFSVGRYLEQKGIPFVSLRDIVDSESEEEKWWVLSHQIAREWYRLPGMKFLEYHGIRIAEAPEPIMQEYLARLFYYTRIYVALKKKFPQATLHFATPPDKDPLNVHCLAAFMPWAVVDAARMAGLRTVVPGTRAVPPTYSFPRMSIKSVVLRTYNACVGFLPRRSFKVYVSEYWTHFAPVVPYLNDTEIVLMESRKLLDIPWRLILKHKIRVRYPNGEINAREERRLVALSVTFNSSWNEARGEVAAYLGTLKTELDWNPVLDACEYLVTYAPRVVADIDALRRIMNAERPDIVLQMASVGGPQHLFFLMARVAAQLGIPSLELQHAGATVDPRSVYSRIETDYLATYGADVNAWHERIGHSPQRLLPVGSPRFDQYSTQYKEGIEKGKRLFAQLGLDTARPVLMVVVPFSDTFASAIDSYQLAEFFSEVRAAQKNIPGVQVLCKFRSYNHIGGMKEYVADLFQVDFAIAGDEDMFSLLCASDAVVCNNTTTIYQAVLAKKPLVLYAWKAFDTYHAQVYERAAPLLQTPKQFAAAIVRVFTDASYREDLLGKQTLFLEGYSFDGKSAPRVASLLGTIAREGKP